MATAIVLLTRDLRLDDNPALQAAVESADRVVPLFVVDDGIRATTFNRPNRAKFLAESLADLDQRLRRRGGALVIRRGDVVEETAKLADQVDAAAVHLAEDYSRYAVRRQQRLRAALARRGLELYPSHVVVAPGDVTPSGGSDHFAVFSPYHRRWSQAPLRRTVPAPEQVSLPDGLDVGELPQQEDICPGSTSPDTLPGGETAGRKRAKDWYDGPVSAYGGDADKTDGHNDLANDGTSRLSPYLHFGCISPVELVARADKRRSGVQAFLRQLAWRDFYHQVLAARPDIRDTDYRSRNDDWNADDAAFDSWKQGRTGYPLVDAGMRQLAHEGWMHNRARLVTGSFLTKHLYIDWRAGAQHFFDYLLDGDVANNCMNWQWVAGTGTDTRPHRVLNPVLQAEKYDADRRYVQKWIPELGTPDYPEPIVDHREAVAAFRAARGR